jgi:hypothetical protein
LPGQLPCFPDELNQLETLVPIRKSYFGILEFRQIQTNKRWLPLVPEYDRQQKQNQNDRNDDQKDFHFLVPFLACVDLLFDIRCICLAGVDTLDRDQRQAQGIEPAQQTLQSGLVNDDAGQGGDRRAIALALDRDRHPPDPI